MTQTEHIIAVLVCATLVVVLVAVGRVSARQSPARELKFRRWMFWFGLLPWIVVQTLNVLPPWIEPAYSLPLHFCDLAGIIAPFALIVDRRLPRALLFFWGLMFTPQAIITPAISSGPDEIWFYTFWLLHAIILGFALYDVVVRGFRPNRRDLMVVMVASVAWVALMFLLNLATGWNYAFVGRATPDSSTLLDALGPWPLRVVWMIVIGNSAFVVLWMPFEIARRRAIEQRSFIPESHDDAAE